MGQAACLPFPGRQAACPTEKGNGLLIEEEAAEDGVEAARPRDSEPHVAGDAPCQIRAAVEARQDPDLVIIARTDANAVHGLEDALRRGKAYHEAGADVIFIEAPRSMTELRSIAQAFPGVPLLFNWAESGKTPPLPLEEIRALGFKLVIFPVSLLFAATYSMLGLLEVLKQGQTPTSFASQMVTFSQFTDHIGLPDIQALEKRYGVNQ